MNMKLNKTQMIVDGNTVSMSMPFAKLDESKRTVSGWATLDNVDTQGDVVLAEASVKAFSRARGNIREMHQPLAVGRLVDFVEKEYYDTVDKAFYRGIFVTARISEGAEDTWKKVLDGTLSGFSIGGEIKEVSNEFVKDAGRTIRFVKDYDLLELSLVDNPANQLSNFASLQKSVFSIQRSDNGSVKVEGMIAETEIENVFICKNDDMIVVENSESQTCPQCGNRMENAGWFESSENRVEKVKSIVSGFMELEAANLDEQGGVEMKKKDTLANAEKAASLEETPQTDEVPVDESDLASVEVEGEPADELAGTGEETASPDEIEEDEQTKLEKTISEKITAIHDSVKSSLEDAGKQTTEQYESLGKKISEARESFLNKASELEEKLDNFGEKLRVQKGRLEELETSLSKMNEADAFRKSVELSTERKNVQKESFWGNAFSPGR